MDSASGLINEIKNGLRKYIDIIAVVAGMIVLVTITVFYTIVQADLVKRRTELYLYRIYGASPVKAQNVIFNEYLTIALITSFAVSFTVMLCGEIYFYFGLNKHFPLSIPVIAATTIFTSAFIFICCKITGTMNINSTGIEVIRDE